MPDDRIRTTLRINGRVQQKLSVFAETPEGQGRSQNWIINHLLERELDRALATARTDHPKG
jgi:hypothetical protein